MNASAWLGGGLALSLWLAAPPAHAAISAQIPPECGSLSDFEHELEQRLGNVSTPEATRVTLTPEDDGYHLLVEVGEQRRELHDASCQELLHAAIVIALALLEPKREEAAAPAPEPAPPAKTEPQSSPPPETKTSRRSQPKFALGAGAGVHLGMLPSATLMLELEAQLKWKRFGVAAGFRYFLPASERDEREHGARIGALGASLTGLFEPWRRVQFRLGVASYRLSATGLGSQQPIDGSAWEVAPTLGAAFVPFERPPFWTRVGLEGQLNLVQPSFEILSYDEVFHVPWGSGSALVHAGVIF
ncbi:MAG TPA: hypothetical protein VFK05_14710 [Polyangiaceae bacterium]|nr:hypothetical protein [Polyangiaceae bacterium]